MISYEMTKKLEAHWTYINGILKLAYELGQASTLDWELVKPLMEELYLSSMFHGYKHAEEENK